MAEIVTWYWELWNEPDIFYWRGTAEEFNTLYDYTAAAVKAACPEARVGGPATTNPAPGSKAAAYLDGFLAHCADGVNAYTGERGTPLDFVTFHVKGGGYRADPLHRKQAPPVGEADPGTYAPTAMRSSVNTRLRQSRMRPFRDRPRRLGGRRRLGQRQSELSQHRHTMPASSPPLSTKSAATPGA